MVEVRSSGRATGSRRRKPGGTTHSRAGIRAPAGKGATRFRSDPGRIRLKIAGMAGARRIAVDYRAGDVPYRAFYDHSVWLCTGSETDPARCIDPDWYER